MEMRPVIRDESAGRRLGDGAFLALAALAVFLSYWAVFRITNPGGAADHALSALRSLVSLALVAAAFVPLLRRVQRWRPAAQVPAHAALACAFALIWYWLLMVTIGLLNGESPLRFSVEPFFPNPAVAWQLLQGAAVYAAVAALTALRTQPPHPGFVLPEAVPDEGPRPSLSRYFIRDGEDIRPVEVGQIVSIAGADDYAEVTTLTGSHLVRMTLAELEKALAGGSFIRVHRSRIVNVDRIARAEPAGGGRMLLHMETGEIIQASRAGSRLLRDRVI